MDKDKPRRIDSLGRVTEPLAEHLWEKSWQKTSPQPEVDWDSLYDQHSKEDV